MRLAIALSLALATTAGAAAQQLPDKVTLDCRVGFNRLLLAIHGKPGRREFATGTEIIIRIPDEHALYTVTKPQHDAFPAIVMTQFDVGTHGTIRYDQCGYGKRTAFATFLTEVKSRSLAQVTDGPAPRALP